MDNPNKKDFKTILADEGNNFIATSDYFPEEFRYADRLLYLYENLASNINKYPRELTPVLQMYWSCFRGFLIGIQLMFKAHIPEAYAIISRSAEAVASARKMSMNPEKVEGWIKAEKETSQPFRRILGKLFPEGDRFIYPEIFNIYELTSEYGRHPSFNSTIFFSDFGRMKTDNKVDFTYSDIEDKPNLKRCINYSIYAYFKFLSLFREIFKNNLNKSWIEEYEIFEKDYNMYKETLRREFQRG